MGRGLSSWSAGIPTERTLVGAGGDLPALFHRLNNQLGIVLANAELLEVQLSDPAQRGRAAQIVSSTLEAMATARELSVRLDPPDSTPASDPD
jgi:hypothetical protein